MFFTKITLQGTQESVTRLGQVTSLQFVVHDTVWGGVNLVKPIDKDKKDTPRVIILLYAGNQEKTCDHHHQHDNHHINCDCG